MSVTILAAIVVLTVLQNLLHITYELFDIYKNLPLNVVLPVYKICVHIEEKHINLIETDVSISIEIVVYEDGKGKNYYLSKVLISKNC